ncbi:hypothetical protein ACFQS2_05715 [Brachybacterium sp. GCM10030267]|uniref:hypothetical protein n=1 Tax=Brachybacterium sp. GCM10030267 TaxID=3273381 RepID=UPI00360ABCC9
MTHDTAESAPPQRSNPAGLVSLIAGILQIVVLALLQALTPALPWFAAQYDLPTRSLSLIMAAPPLVIAIVAIIFGVIGLVSTGRRRTAAVIGTTLGVSHVVVAGLGLVGIMIVGATLS